MDKRTKYQLILNAIQEAKRTIQELNTDAETGQVDYSFGGDERLEDEYFKLNDYALHITEEMKLDFWWNK